VFAERIIFVSRGITVQTVRKKHFLALAGNMVERSFDKSTFRTFSLQTVTTNRRTTGVPYDLCVERQIQFYVFQLIYPNTTYICLENVDLSRTAAPHTLRDRLSSNLQFNKQLQSSVDKKNQLDATFLYSLFLF